jgi:preprotein translocase subunit SecD
MSRLKYVELALILAITVFSIIVVWPGRPERYLPGDFWPDGKGISVGDFEREELRLGLDLRGGVRLVLEANPPEDFEGDLDNSLDVAADTLERRVNAFGVAESEITRQTGDRISVSLPGITIEEAEDLVGRTAQLQLMEVNNGATPGVDGAVQGSDGQVWVPAIGVNEAGESKPFTGEYLRSNAFVTTDIAGLPAVAFETTGEGGELLEDITGRLRGRQMAFFLDEDLISAPVVRDVLSDSGQITGLTFRDADRLAAQLNAGALPVPLTVVQRQQVSATLGDEAVRDSVVAGQVGLLAVVIFMIMYYRLPGVVASLALVTYTFATLAVFKLWPVTLTLSGIAAFVLSVGIAVDANILIFERMKEELRQGRPLGHAIDAGFARAWNSVRDSNIATLITTAVLYWFGDQFGASLVKGFALTLAIGVGVSLFSAVFVTRTYLKVLEDSPLARRLWLWGADRETWEDHSTPTATPSTPAVEGGS